MSTKKTCLENIKSNDVQYTRQNTDEHTSSISSRPESLSLSNHSASSNDSYEKRCLRCYICGTDVPTYLKGIHEKTCKKNWESGLLNVDRKSNVRADIFRSLSRSSSKSEINCNQTKPGGLRKAKSSTLYRTKSFGNDISASNDDLRANSHLGNVNSKSATNLSKSQTSLNASASQSNNLDKRNLHLDLKSSSSTSIQNSNSRNTLKSNISKYGTKNKPMKKTTSLQDLRRNERTSTATSPISTKSPTTPTSPTPSIDKQKSTPNNPQYIVCHLCGKLYSQHSIVIHIKQCERTRALQKSMGTNVDYKIKSRSLADLSKGKVGTPRVKKISDATAPSYRTDGRPSTGRSYDRPKGNSSVSYSMENLSFVTKKETDTTEVKKNKLNGDNTSLEKKKSNGHDINNQTALSTPGLQKCYLCGQLYGTRSLPIHQKQCYVKQERIREQEGQSKKKKRREIKLIPFGKSQFPEKQTSSLTNRSTFSESPGLKMRSNSLGTQSRVFGVETPVGKKGFQTNKTENINKDPNMETDDDIEERRLSSTFSNGTQSPYSSQSSISFQDLMMKCVHCGCQCEPYTMAIHEKVCRKMILRDGKSCPEIKIDSTSNEPNNCINMEETITNGGLIHCEGCNGEFFSSEIFQHRINCRTSTL